MVNITSGQQNDNSVVHIQDIPEQLRSEAVSQIIYNIIKQDPSLSQGNTVLLSQAYNVIHSINYEKYMSGLLSKDRNVVSLMGFPYGTFSYIDFLTLLITPLLTQKLIIRTAH